MIELSDLIAIDTESKGGGTFGPLEMLYSIAWYDDTDKGCEILNWVPGEGDYQADWERITKGKIPIFHNAAHDVSVLRELGISVPVYHCSMIMGYNLNPNMKLIRTHGQQPSKYGIDAWGVRLGLPKLKHPAWGEWEQSPTFYEELPDYNIRDAEICWRILDDMGVLRKLQRDEQAWDYYMSVDLPFIEVIIELNSTGMLVDEEKISEWEEELQPVQDGLLVQMREMTSGCSQFMGKKTYHKKKHDRDDGFYTGTETAKGYEFVFYADDFEPTSAAHIKQAYKELYDAELENTQGEYLEEKFGDLPLTPLLVEYRNLNKLLTTYCRPFREKRSEDNYVRASWKQMLITGRISSEDPSLQVLPSRDELGATFRKFIVAPTGYKIVRIDFSNIEIRVMTGMQAQYFMERKGYIPDDVQKIVDVFWNDPETPAGDFHGTMTTIWFNLKPGDKDFKHMRSNVAKHITFARAYGAGIKKLALKMKVDYNTAKKRKKLADETNPSFEEFKQWIEEEFEENNGWNHTLFGRRLHYPSFLLDLTSDDEETLPNGEVVPGKLKEYVYQKGKRQGFNAKAGQGTAADILKMVCVAILHPVWALGARFCGLIHDELLLYVPDENVQDVMKILYLAVNRDDLLPYVPVRGTPSWGSNWLEAKDTKENIYHAD